MDETKKSGLQLASSNNAREAEANRLLLSAAGSGREACGNILRVLRGHGKAEALARELEKFAADLRALSECDRDLVELRLVPMLRDASFPDQASDEHDYLIREAL